MSHKPKTPKQWLRTSVEPQTQLLQHYAQFAVQLKQWQQLFKRITGHPLHDHCQLINVRDNKLIVEVSAATWATQLKMQQARIITHFQQDATVAVDTMEVKVKPRQTAGLDNGDDKVSRRERILRLAENSQEPLKSELLRIADKMW